MLHYMHFSRSGVVMIACGAFLGQLFEYSYFVNSGMMNTSAWLWYRTTPVKIVIRLVLTGAMIVTAAIIPMFFTE